MPTTTQLSGPPGVTRAWNDANTNFVPDCDLLESGGPGSPRERRRCCGVMSNTSFGTNVLTNNFDQLLGGWGVRPSDWNLGTSLAQRDRLAFVSRITCARSSEQRVFPLDDRASGSTPT